MEKKPLLHQLWVKAGAFSVFLREQKSIDTHIIFRYVLKVNEGLFRSICF